jgi:L-arabinose transport system substrate-binding protein
MKFLKTALVVSALAALSATTLVAPALAETKIGFVVKQPEEPWFQDEWRFAQQAADEKGFTLVKIGALDGEQLMSAIDNMGAQGVQGFIVCTPDVKLGPGIVAKAEANGLKLMTVDDQLVDAAGNTPAYGHLGHQDRRSCRRVDRC